MDTTAALRQALADPALWARAVLTRPLRPYQIPPARAIVRSVIERRGGSISLMFSRQAGKNEVSGTVESLLLARYQAVAGAQIVKAAPTFRPQLVNSLLRLQRCLNNPVTRGHWHGEFGNAIRLAEARAVFFSTSPGAQIVGATASLLLEVDEAQDVDEDRHDKDLMPMAASTNALRVYYGTAWTEDTLLAKVARRHRELEARDGIQRHFHVPWTVVAECVPAYGAFVEAERQRLGESHPMFRTQYLLEELEGGGRLLKPETLRAMHGTHSREENPAADLYVAGVDVAGEDEAHRPDDVVRSEKPRQDSTVVTIARVHHEDLAGATVAWCEVVEHYWWTGRDHRSQLTALLALLRRFGVQRVCVDGTGVGAGVASLLLGALSDSVVDVVLFTAASKSQLGLELLAAANGGRLSVYQDDCDESREFWHEAEAARYEARPGGLIGWSVPESEGHDDFVSSLALCVCAANQASPAAAGEVVHARRPYEGERG